jgi:hypothetical protein
VDEDSGLPGYYVISTGKLHINRTAHPCKLESFQSGFSKNIKILYKVLSNKIPYSPEYKTRIFPQFTILEIGSSDIGVITLINLD